MKKTLISIPTLSLVGCVSLILLYIASLYNFLLFHILIELFSIVISFMIFVFAWNTINQQTNDYLLFLGISYLFIGILDLAHTLSYKGMNIFTGYDANLPTQLWIISRYMESISLLSAFLFFRYKLRLFITFLFYFLITFLLLLSVFYLEIFPDCFIEGSGLTLFKKISEYVISFIILVALILLFINRKHFDENIIRLLAISFILTIISELSFTFYINVYGLSNLIGHFFKLLSFYCIYRAIIRTGITQPFELLFHDLKTKEKQLNDANSILDYKVKAKTRELMKSNEELQLKNEEYETLNEELRQSNEYLILTQNELKKNTTQLKEQARLLNLIFKHTLDSIVLLDKDYNFIRVSDTYAKSCKRHVSDFPGKNHFDLYPSDLQEEFDEFKAMKAIYRRKARSFIFPDHPLWGTTYWDLGLVPIFDENNTIELFLFTLKDVTEEVWAKQEIERNKERLELVISVTHDGIWDWNIESGDEYFSPRWCEIIGYDYDDKDLEHTYEAWSCRIHPDDYSFVMQELDSHLKHNTPYDVEYRHLHKSGEYRWQKATGKAIRNKDGKPIRMVGRILDITKQKKSEEIIHQALQEKTILLQELYHRTKNNMQIICSMLKLKRHYSQSPEVKDQFLEAENKIRAMALVHSKLYQSKNLSNISLKDYIVELIDLIGRSYSINKNTIRINILVEDIPIIIDVAIPLGLIVNELLSNIIKHAFPNNEGTITVTIKNTNNNIFLSVEDDGIGAPEGLNYYNTNTLGLQTVINIVENQLSGEIKFTSDKGFKCVINFKNLLYTERI